MDTSMPTGEPVPAEVGPGNAVTGGCVNAGGLESEWAMAVPASLAARAAAAEAVGQTAVFAGWDGQIRGVLVVADTVKPTSAEAVTRLRGMGLRSVLLTSENDRAARAVASAVGLSEVIAGVLPAGKVDAVKKLGVPQPADRRSRDGVQLRVRRVQQPAATAFPARARPPGHHPLTLPRPPEPDGGAVILCPRPRAGPVTALTAGLARLRRHGL